MRQINHVLNGCPVALQQGRFTFRHDAVLSCLMAELQKACLDGVEIFADLDGKRASESGFPPATIPLLYWCVLAGRIFFLDEVAIL